MCTTARHRQPLQQRRRADNQRISRADDLLTPAAVAKQRQEAGIASSLARLLSLPLTTFHGACGRSVCRNITASALV
jgi:hypothetical protein